MYERPLDYLKHNSIHVTGGRMKTKLLTYMSIVNPCRKVWNIYVYYLAYSIVVIIGMQLFGIFGWNFRMRIRCELGVSNR